MPQPTMTSASKVGDLFAAAGDAFTKLAELTRILQTAAKNDSHLSSNENNLSEAQWLASDTESLQMAVKRFGDELNVISEHIKDKTMYQIKTTFRKIQPTLSNAATSNEKSGAETSPSVSATFGAHDSSNSYSADNAVASSSALSSMVAPSVAAKAAASTQNASSSNATIASNSFPQTSSASGVNPGAAAAASSCSSPSPFLHYPLLRKSADITLNMLNARDDSDDDERVSMSVFNSV